MKLISIWTPKGGAGKSTITLNLADAIIEAGKTVGVVDADRQRTLMKIHADGKLRVPIMPMSDQVTGKGLLKVNKFDFILVDFGPGIGFTHQPGEVRSLDSAYEKRMREIIECSDLVLSPLTPSRADFQALAEGVKDLKIKRHFLVANRIDSRLREDVEFLKVLKSQKAKFSVIHSRTVFRRAFNAGYSVFREPNNQGIVDKLVTLYGAGDARREISFMLNQIEEVLK